MGGFIKKSVVQCSGLVSVHWTFFPPHLAVMAQIHQKYGNHLHVYRINDLQDTAWELRTDLVTLHLKDISKPFQSMGAFFYSYSKYIYSSSLTLVWYSD